MGVLPAMLEEALRRSAEADAVLNFGYDWLPLWLTPWVTAPLFHLISMGSVSDVMQRAIESVAQWNQGRLAFHTQRQASDFNLQQPARVVGNSFDLTHYTFRDERGGPLGWAGRIAPEKGLEDAAAAAAALGDRLLVWGFVRMTLTPMPSNPLCPPARSNGGGSCPPLTCKRAGGVEHCLIHRSGNEAYGNVVVEAMACGVPVIA